MCNTSPTLTCSDYRHSRSKEFRICTNTKPLLGVLIGQRFNVAVKSQRESFDDY
jgi:uncharacterized membrane protein